ncbi:hypothetical protein DSO57_1024981 [Entomophthora muscae]|uniref:Uncharacterized protein n=1 Tax=Entomophthora muscae TaxID=34485 RepID=A0ACC2SF88_9FUNG|nr:hypothetical protein DSO57_1024981 [Entomophthora muscae]
MGPCLVSNVEASTDQAAALKWVHQELQVTLAAAVTTYKEYTDCKRQEGPTYRPGTETPSSQPIIVEGEPEYELNCILASEFYKRNPTAVGHPKLTLAAMKLLPTHKNFSLSHLLDGGIVPQANVEDNVTLGSIMLGIIQPSRKAQKAKNRLQN